MNHRIRKPDPLLLLALAVGLGVVVTTAVHADPLETDASYQLQEAGARLALSPIKGLAQRLEMYWLNTALDSPAAGRILTHRPLDVGRPFGEDGPELSLSWRPRIGGSARLAGDKGIGDVGAARPEIYLSLRRSW